MNNPDLTDKLSELNADLAKLRAEGAKGTLKKQAGDLRWIRRDIARIMTILNERDSKKNHDNT
jgi:large subunit ribosomal protein L29